MSDKDIIDIGYFNIDNKKNSILENADFQDNSIAKHLDDIENLTNIIKQNILDSQKTEENKMIDFIKIKKNN